MPGRKWTVGVRDEVTAEEPEVRESGDSIEDFLKKEKEKPQEEELEEELIEPDEDSDSDDSDDSDGDSSSKSDPTSNGYDPNRSTESHTGSDDSSTSSSPSGRNFNQDGVDNGYQDPNSAGGRRRPGGLDNPEQGGPGGTAGPAAASASAGGAAGGESGAPGGASETGGGGRGVSPGPQSDPYDDNLGKPGERPVDSLPEEAGPSGNNNGLPNQPNQGLGEEGGGPGGLEKKDELGDNPNGGLGNQGPGGSQGPKEEGPNANANTGNRESGTQGGPGSNGYGATNNLGRSNNDPTANARRNLEHQNRTNGPVSSNGASGGGSSSPRGLSTLGNAFNSMKQKLNPFSRLGLNRNSDGSSGGKLDGGGNTESTEAEHGKVSLGKKILSFIVRHPYIAGIVILILIILLLILDTAVIEPSTTGSSRRGHFDYGNYELSSDNDEILHEPLDQFLQSQGTSLEEFNKLIENNVDKAGYGTRAGVVAAAVTLIAEMGNNYDKKIPYFWGGGHGDGIATGAKARWGSTDCHTYANGQDYNYCGLDCSGFVPWAINNGGFNVHQNLAGNFQYLSGAKRVTLSSSQAVIQPGDILESSHHVVLVVGIDDEKKQYICAEASGNQYGVQFTRRPFADGEYWGVNMDGYYANNAKSK